MSAVNTQSQSLPATADLHKAIPSAAEKLSTGDEARTLTSKVCRLGLSTNTLTKDQLLRGITVPLKTAALKGSKGIISRVAVTNCFSDVDSEVHVSADMFQNTAGEPVSASKLGLENSLGWPFFKPGAANFVPLFKMHPLEAARFAEGINVYEPASQLSDRYVEQYGETTPESLKAAVISLPGEPFSLVDRDSVVARIVDTNWEILGTSASQAPSTLSGDRWLRVADSICDHVVRELQTSVLDKIPFSNLQNINAHIQVPHESAHMLDDDATCTVGMELKVDYQVKE